MKLSYQWYPLDKGVNMFVLFVCLFWVARAIFQLSGDCHHCRRQGCKFRAICLALTAFSSEGSFTYHTYCDTGPSFLRSYPKDPWFYLLGEGAITTYFKHLRFDAAGSSGARTHDLLFAKREHYHKATTTGLYIYTTILKLWAGNFGL
jgi:hypothetical protein